MLLVKTSIGQSKIHGFGLFADQFIPKDTEVWRFTPGFDQKFTKKQILAFPKLLQLHISKYGWQSKKNKLYIFSADNGKYFNHADNPNTLSEYKDNEEEVITTAIKDIEIGEELTDNYSSFEADNDEDNILEEIRKKESCI